MSTEEHQLNVAAKAKMLIVALYAIVDQLEALYPGRRFTPDGHLVGSIGECLAQYHYGVTLHAHSTAGCDGTVGESSVEVKATQATSIAMRCQPSHLLVFKLHRDGTFDEVYNGPGERVWQLVAHKKAPSNGQRSVRLSTLKKLMETLPVDQRLERLR